MYRQLAARVEGRLIETTFTPDDWYLKGTNATQLRDAVAGSVVERVARHGKLLLIELTDNRPVLGLRFGMTGRLLVDGDAAIETLEYSSDRNDAAWDRFGLVFTEGTLFMRDPRRLGGVELDPDLGGLGPDAWRLTPEKLASSLAGGRGPLKARLLDQKRVAGLGNLLCDETLWRARLSPHRRSADLSSAETARLCATVHEVLDELFRRGGSHRGDLHEERHGKGICPLDGEPLQREKVGGRTTYWCAAHQR